MEMRQIARDIIKIKISEDKTLKQLFEMFYDVMRKHGIYEGEMSCDGAGVLKANPEWTICKCLFFSQISQYIEFESCFGSLEAPEDVEVKKV